MSEQAQTQVMYPGSPWNPANMATVKHLPARPSTSSGLLWKRRNVHNASSSSFTNSNFTVSGGQYSPGSQYSRQAILTARLCRQEKLEALNLRRSATTLFPRVTPTQRPSLTSTGNTAVSNTATTNSASSGKKSASACDSGSRSVAEEPRCEVGEDCEQELTEEELEKRKNVEKCLTWVQSLPDKFSSMHIVQQTVFADDS